MCCSPSRKGRIADRLRIAQAPFSIFVQSVDIFRIALKLHTKTAPEAPARTPGGRFKTEPSAPYARPARSSSEPPRGER
ncbi:hypothetical protein HMPREF0185_01802 [Brevundimonas diminuta 470-4]|nr:hypothetical protein HMPREF0185_01802 [Brevundimonas diminuta 470-4]